jgi:hypothetical protein
MQRIVFEHELEANCRGQASMASQREGISSGSTPKYRGTGLNPHPISPLAVGLKWYGVGPHRDHQRSDPLNKNSQLVALCFKMSPSEYLLCSSKQVTYVNTRNNYGTYIL